MAGRRSIQRTSRSGSSAATAATQSIWLATALKLAAIAVAVAAWRVPLPDGTVRRALSLLGLTQVPLALAWLGLGAVMFLAATTPLPEAPAAGPGPGRPDPAVIVQQLLWFNLALAALILLSLWLLRRVQRLPAATAAAPAGPAAASGMPPASRV